MSSPQPASADRISRVIFEHAARISREQDIDALLRLNADLARDLAGADRCTIWLAEESSRELWTKVAHGIDPIRIPMGSGIVGACVSGDRPIVVNDPSSDSRFYAEVDDFSGYHTQSLIVVPLRAEGKVIGALQVLNKPKATSSYLASQQAMRRRRLRRSSCDKRPRRRACCTASWRSRATFSRSCSLTTCLPFRGLSTRACAFQPNSWAEITTIFLTYRAVSLPLRSAM
jgi:putative methionine-R-sulfoxide reductase with GAF domain